MRKGRSALLFLLLSALLGALVFFPLFLLGMVGFFENWPWPNLIPPLLSFRSWNYIFAAHSPFAEPFQKSLLVATCVAAVCAVTCFTAAVGMRRVFGAQRIFLDILFLAPVLVPPFAVAMGLHVVALQFNGVERFSTVVLVHVFANFPYCLRALQAGLHPQLTHMECQATSLGANPWQVLRLVTFPGLIPSVLVGASFSFLGSMGEFVLTSLIGGGATTTLPLVLYPFLVAGDRSLSAVASLLLIVPTIVFIVLLERILQKWTARRFR